MMEMGKKLDMSKLTETLAQLKHYADPERSTWTPPPRTQRTKVDRKFFLDTLVEFKKAGYEATWSNKHTRVELRIYDVPFIYWGFRRAAEALLERIEEWKT